MFVHPQVLQLPGTLAELFGQRASDSTILLSHSGHSEIHLPQYYCTDGLKSALRVIFQNLASKGRSAAVNDFFSSMIVCWTTIVLCANIIVWVVHTVPYSISVF